MSNEQIDRAIALAEAWQTNPDPELFEERVLPALRPLLERAQASSDPRDLADWLETYSSIAGVADEELATGTSDLLAADPGSAMEARALLSSSTQARLGLFLEEWASGDEESAVASLQYETLTPQPVLETVPDPRPVLVKFVGESTFTSTRGFLTVKGLMTISERNGAVAGTFETTTGGGASTFRRTNGPVPPGTYVVSNFMIRDKLGMVKHGIGYSLNLDPTPGTPVFGRSLFRIHPDGASPGTNGCLGVVGNAAKLTASRDLLRRLLEGGRYLASVTYSGFV